MTAYPKPDPERVNRVKPRFDWVDLPAQGRTGRAPPLPKWRTWQAQTKRWWVMLWAKPQAIMWESNGSTMWTLAALYDDLISGHADVARVSAEMRAHEDRHGLNPKAMLQLRWRIVADEVEQAREQRTQRKRLRAVDPGAVARTD